MIARLTAGQLRKLADQLDALTALEAAGADHQPSNTLLKVDGEALAYAHWWHDQEQYMAELTCFTPGNAPPLAWHPCEALHAAAS